MTANKKQENAVDEDLKSPVSLKRRIVKQGIFKAELNWFLMKELAEDGYRFDSNVKINGGRTLCTVGSSYSVCHMTKSK
jgi:hypothetical protein